jgi:hypothetical protein
MVLWLILAVPSLANRQACASEYSDYDEAAPNSYPAQHAVLQKHREELMKIPDLIRVFIGNDGYIVVQIRKRVPGIAQYVPPQIDGYPTRVVCVEEVLQRHLHELEQIAGPDRIYRCGIESLPDGEPAIVVRVTQYKWDQSMKVPDNIEGVPLRVLTAQEPLTH